MRPTVYWIPHAARGRLAIVSEPCGGHRLDDEMRALSQKGIDTLVCLLSESEREELGLAREAEACTAVGLQFVWYPIADRGVPSSVSETRRLIEDLVDRLEDSEAVAFHCCQGMGRSALLAACVLTVYGDAAEAAWARAAKARGWSIRDTQEQHDWVRRFAGETHPPAVDLFYPLVRGALDSRHLPGSGGHHCARLEEAGEAVLPSIESLVLDEVMRCYHCSTDALEGKYPGLRALLVTYFAIAKDAGSARAGTFFGRMYGSVRVVAMGAVDVAWMCRAPTAPMPEEMLAVIRELAEVGSGETRQVARWLLGRAEEADRPVIRQGDMSLPRSSLAVPSDSGAPVTEPGNPYRGPQHGAISTVPKPGFLMTPDEAFLRVIFESPDDDTPRLIYADWLEEQGNPRGEFIRLQVELARMAAKAPQRHRYEARQQELWSAHAEEWVAREWPQVLPEEVRYVRGFATEVSLRDSQQGDAEVRALADSPYSAALTFLDLRENRFRPETVQVLGKFPRLLALESLGGCAPVEGEGVVGRHRFYFRARHRAWSFSLSEDPAVDASLVYATSERGFAREGDYGDSPYAASYMPLDEAVAIIRRCAEEYRKLRGLGRRETPAV